MLTFQTHFKPVPYSYNYEVNDLHGLENGHQQQGGAAGQVTGRYHVLYNISVNQSVFKRILTHRGPK